MTRFDAKNRGSHYIQVIFFILKKLIYIFDDRLHYKHKFFWAAGRGDLKIMQNKIKSSWLIQYIHYPLFNIL